MQLLKFLLVFAVTIAVSQGENEQNTRPVVGILTQEVSPFIRRKYKDENFQSYIAASYVKFVEGAGGRVVPIWLNRSREYYEDLMSHINGVLLPGGATFFNQSHGYAETGKIIYDIAVEMNNDDIYMPIWGTCLGFELLVYLAANSTDYRTSCSSSAQALPLEFEPNFEESILFSNVSPDILMYMKQLAVTANFHIYCYTPETFEEYGLNKYWNVLATSQDRNGVTFISVIEHTKYPFYGVQFHPEKNIYEFVSHKNIPHFQEAIYVAQYFANFFSGETRKNTNNFNSKAELQASLIYNYQPLYTGAEGSAFEQQYLFGTNNITEIYSKRNSGSLQNIFSFTVTIIIAFMAIISPQIKY